MQQALLPLLAKILVFHFLASNVSDFSSLVDSLASNCAYPLFFFFFLLINSKYHHGGIPTPGPTKLLLLL